MGIEIEERPAQMSMSALKARCMSEIDAYRRGEPSDSRYCLELFRRATTQSDPLAWEVIQQCFNEIMLCWMHRHPMREAARRLDSEENYVAQTLTRFWQATSSNQIVEFRTMASALRYLHASLNGIIIDTLRAYSRPKEVPLPEPGEGGELLATVDDGDSELWEVIRGLLPGGREQHVAYLLFHCGLKPREIVRFCSQEFGDVQEIYRLRRSIMERLVRKADQIRWHLGSKERAD